jgi:hypothetical protein
LQRRKIFLEHAHFTSHCKEDSIDVLPEIKLRGLVSNSYIHVSVSDLYIPTIGSSILLQQNMQADRWNI